MKTGNFLTYLGQDSKQGSGERHLAVSGDTKVHAYKVHDFPPVMSSNCGTIELTLF